MSVLPSLTVTSPVSSSSVHRCMHPGNLCFISAASSTPCSHKANAALCPHTSLLMGTALGNAPPPLPGKPPGRRPMPGGGAPGPAMNAMGQPKGGPCCACCARNSGGRSSTGPAPGWPLSAPVSILTSLWASGNGPGACGSVGAAGSPSGYSACMGEHAGAVALASKASKAPVIPCAPAIPVGQSR